MNIQIVSYIFTAIRKMINLKNLILEDLHQIDLD